MKYVISVNLFKDEEIDFEPDYTINIIDDVFFYIKNHDIFEIEKDPKVLNYIVSYLEENISFFELIQGDYEQEMLEEYKNLLKKVKSSKNLLSLFDTVIIAGSFEDELAYIIKNKSYLMDKKIVLANNYEISKMGYNQALNHIELLNKNNIKDVQITIESNKSPITMEVFSSIINYIDKIIDDINKDEYSPLEKIAFVYDELKKRIYQEEDHDQDASESRELSKVLLGDKIVCAGYVAVFNLIMSIIGIKSGKIYLKRDNVRIHVRSICLIDDPKYKVKGLYQFDVTGDTRLNESDEEYYNNYYYFAKTLNETYPEDLRFNLCYETPFFNQQFLKLLRASKQKHLSYVELVSGGYIKSVNRLLELIGENTIDFFNGIDVQKLLIIYQRILRELNHIIPPSVIVDLLCKVRTIEHKKDEKVPLNSESVTASVVNNKFKPYLFSTNDQSIMSTLNIISREEYLLFQHHMVLKKCRLLLEEEKKK